MRTLRQGPIISAAGRWGNCNEAIGQGEMSVASNRNLQSEVLQGLERLPND